MKETKQRYSCYECKRFGVDCAAMHPPHKHCFKEKIENSPCKRCGGTGQVDDPAAGNSNMLTMMPCPDCD